MGAHGQARSLQYRAICGLRRQAVLGRSGEDVNRARRARAHRSFRQLRAAAVGAFDLWLPNRRRSSPAQKSADRQGGSRSAHPLRKQGCRAQGRSEGDTTRHKIEINPAIEMVKTSDAESDIRENTQRFVKAIEKAIREHPDHWNWIHRRWKTRPPGEARFY